MTGPVPSDVVSVADYQRHARERLSPDIWAYISGAGADGLTQGRNRSAFDQIELAGRVLADMKGASTTTTLLGIDLPFPLLLAPVAHQRLAHPDGELATVLGAGACGATMCVSTLASTTIEEIAAQATSPLIFQLYMQGSREDALSLVRRAENSGYSALMVTVDAPVNGVRNDEQKAGFHLPAHVRPVNIEGMKGPLSRAGPGESPVFKGLLDAAPTWADIEWLRGQTNMPLMLKGVMHPDDAERAIDLGVDAIVISNHGGRTLDTLPASVMALQAVNRQVAGRVPLLLDGGVRRGTDIFKALALGASACMIGQPIMHALAVAGPVGIAHLLVILQAELEVAMALTGRPSIEGIDSSAIWGRLATQTS